LTATAATGQSDVGPARPWLIAGAASAANFVTFGVLFSFGVFLTPLADSFGTTTGQIAPLLSGAVLFYYLTGAVAGWFSDRYGIRPVVTVGALSLAAGLALTAQANELWQAYLAYIPLVGVGVGCCYAPLIGTVGRWFTHHRTLATALLLVGVSGGTLVAPIAGRLLVDEVGWRSTFTAFALIALAVLGVAAAVATDPPRAVTSSSPSILLLLRSRRLQGLYASAIVIGPGFYAPFAFYNDYAIDNGVGATAAAALVGIMGAASLVARLAFGLTGDRFGPFLLYRAGYALMLLSLLLWLVAGRSYSMLTASAISHGIGWAAWVTATPVVLAAWFGTGSLGGIVGAFYTGLGVGALLGPAVSGFVVDNHGFGPAVALAATTTALALAIALVSTSGGGLTLLEE